MGVRLGWETFLLIVRIEFICKSHALCNLSHGRMNIWGDSVHGQISFPYTQKTTALEQKTQKTTALEQKTVFRSRAAVFWVYRKLIWPWYEESNTWFLQAILSLGPDSEKVRLVLKVGFCATKKHSQPDKIWRKCISVYYIIGYLFIWSLQFKTELVLHPYLHHTTVFVLFISLASHWHFGFTKITRCKKSL